MISEWRGGHNELRVDSVQVIGEKGIERKGVGEKGRQRYAKKKRKERGESIHLPFTSEMYVLPTELNAARPVYHLDVPRRFECTASIQPLAGEAHWTGEGSSL